MELVLAALGVVAVVEVHDMPDEVCWVADQRVGLIRSSLPPARRAKAMEWLLIEASMPDDETECG